LDFTGGRIGERGREHRAPSASPQDDSLVEKLCHPEPTAKGLDPDGPPPRLLLRRHGAGHTGGGADDFFRESSAKLRVVIEFGGEATRSMSGRAKL